MSSGRDSHSENRELARARERDDADELAGFRSRFQIDPAGPIYLDGNSLGRLPLAALELGQHLLQEQWGGQLIRSWNSHWFQLPERLGAKIARLLGAGEDEVILADSTSVNLFKLSLAALELQSERSDLLTDELNFPSDLHVFESALRLAGRSGELTIAPSPDGIRVPIKSLEEHLRPETALVSLSHTAFKSAFVHDLREVTALAHRAGALMLWDLSHSVGAMPLALSECEVDLAVGCTYKYLNGGPGAPAFLYVRKGLQNALRNPLAGWFGRRDPFAFRLDYEPEPGIRHFLTGTPPVLSLAMIEPGIDLLLEAGIDAIRRKSVAQTDFLIELWEERLEPLGYSLNTPREIGQRGSHVALGHPEGYRINLALIEQLGVLPDFRAPDNIRLGVCPLYTTYEELYLAANALERAVTERHYERHSPLRRGVT